MCCKECGHKLEENARFCSNCGAKVEEIPEIEVEENAVLEVPVMSENSEAVSIEELTCETVSEDFQTQEQLDDDVSERFQDIDNTESVGEVCEVEEHGDADAVSEEQKTDEALTEVSTAKIITENVKQKRSKTKKTSCVKRTSVWGHVFASITSVFLALFLIITFIVATGSMLFSSETISEMLDEIELDDIDIEDFISKDELEENGLKCESDNLFDIIYDNIDQSDLADPLTKSEYRKIIDSDEFTLYFGEVIEKRIDSIVAGKTTSLIEPDDILDFLREEKKAIKKIIGYEITDERIDNLEKNLNENFSEAFGSLEVKLGTSPAAKAVSVVFAKWLLPLLILVDVLFCVLIFIIVRSARVGLKYCGVTMLIVSLIFAIAAYGLYICVVEFFNFNFLSDALSAGIFKLLIIYLSVFASSVIMLITSAIIKRVQRV